MHHARGDYDKALQLYEEAFVMRKKIYGEEPHASIAGLFCFLAICSFATALRSLPQPNREEKLRLLASAAFNLKQSMLMYHTLGQVVSSDLVSLEGEISRTQRDLGQVGST